MSFMRNQRTTSKQTSQAERTRGGPIITVEEPVSGKPSISGMARRLPARTKLESIAYLVIGLAIVVLVVLFIVPSLFSAVTTAFYTSLFVAMLTLSNLRRPSGWANTILGRKVFPVLHTGDGEIWKLAVVNSVLVFVFAFAFRPPVVDINKLLFPFLQLLTLQGSIIEGKEEIPSPPGGLLGHGGPNLIRMGYGTPRSIGPI